MSADKSKSGSLPPCAICKSKSGIYRCPRCHICTCSLECCRVHKTKGNIACNGKRDRTQFCSVKGFTDSQLASDYHFLEDVLKVSESSKRLYHGIANGGDPLLTAPGAISKRAKGNTSTSNGSNSSRLELDSISTHSTLEHPLLRAKEGKSVIEVLAHGVDDMQTDEKQPSHQSNPIINELLAQKPAAKPMPQRKEKIDPLVRFSELKGVNVLRMPSGMQRRQSNTTKFNKKKGIITWKLELCFHQPKDTPGEGKCEETCSSEEKKLSLPRLRRVESEAVESSTLGEELAKHLDVHPGNATTRSTLRSFATAPRDSLVLFMKRLPCSSAAPQYFQLDPDVALMESLKGKTIIEFPTIDVVMEADKGRFPLFIGEIS